MYHLLRGLHEYLTRKDEFSVIIIGMDGAGKSTLLEKIKSMYNKVPGLSPDKIRPTIGQNTGTITLPSTILRFVDLGGQTGIRTLWHRYYDDADAIIYVLDASNRDRLPDSWEVLETVLSAPQIAGSPLLLLANKQDVEHALTVEDVRYEYEAWWHNRANDPRSLHSQRASESGPIMRSASLDVMGISALQGTGIREAIDWLFLRVQNTNNS